ncbi:unnamed protein product [Psylliodes chrysocephalus]|uniref:Uncharacterized protein n=1 Tax=Psylliodes chrysocephalus TaxID=3402493 RepID=A0A9P0CCR5_9CUCU|nr:unnamed protein product [Psylliodes chrysocephala]
MCLAAAPLAKSSSATSCSSTMTQQSGYHTPIDEEEEEPAPLTLTPRSSLANPQAPPSPYSAVMTVSLEGYLDPHRISFSSPPNSEMNPRISSPDDSFPVFSPPPYTEAPTVVTEIAAHRGETEEEERTDRRRSTIGPPWMHGSFITPRQSIISYSSRSPLSHHECNFINESLLKQYICFEV